MLLQKAIFHSFFYGWVILHCIPHLYPVIYWWALRLLPRLDYYKYLMAILLILPTDKACTSKCFPNNVNVSVLYVFKKQAMKSQCGHWKWKVPSQSGPEAFKCCWFPKSFRWFFFSSTYSSSFNLRHSANQQEANSTCYVTIKSPQSNLHTLWVLLQRKTALQPSLPWREYSRVPFESLNYFSISFLPCRGQRLSELAWKPLSYMDLM